MSGIANRYAAQDLFLPKAAHELVPSLVKQAGAGSTAAFDRQIDFWWAGLVIGLHNGRRTSASSLSDGGLSKFNTGVVFDSDPWRIVQLELLALAEEGAEALEVPSRVIVIASEYAYTGVLALAEELRGQPSPQGSLTVRLSELLAEGT
jgi:hypothetical protein